MLWDALLGIVGGNNRFEAGIMLSSTVGEARGEAEVEDEEPFEKNESDLVLEYLRCEGVAACPVCSCSSSGSVDGAGAIITCHRVRGVVLVTMFPLLS